jgi:hypothetical protein
MYATGESRRLQHATIRTTRILLWAALLPAVPLVVFRHEVLSVYLGVALQKYPAAPTVMALLLLTHPSWYSIEPLRRVGEARAMMRKVAICSLIPQVVGVVLACILLGTTDLGAIGVAGAAVASRGVILPLLFLPMVDSLIDMSPWRFFSSAIAPGIAPALVVGVVAEVCRMTLLPNETVWWLSFMLIVGLAQITAIWILLSPIERKDIYAMVGRVFNLFGVRQA